MSNWNKIFKPIVVLCVICIVVTGALAATNSVTAPIIEAATLAAQEAARTELLPDAQGFEKVEGINVANVSDVYRTTNDVGVVITSSAKGYGGDVVATPSYWERYEGVSAAQALVLNQDIDAYSGATISSRAVLTAVNSAIEAYNQIP